MKFYETVARPAHLSVEKGYRRYYDLQFASLEPTTSSTTILQGYPNLIPHTLAYAALPGVSLLISLILAMVDEQNRAEGSHERHLATKKFGLQVLNRALNV